MNTAYVKTSTAIGATPVAIGGPIPVGMVRYIYNMEIVSDDDSNQHIALFKGVSGNEQNGTVAYISTGSKRGYGDHPFIVVSPTRSSGTVTDNQLYVAHETSAVHVTMTYEDVVASD